MQVQLHLGNTGILVQVNTVCHEKEQMSRKKVATGEKQQSGQCHQVNALRSKQTYEITSHRNTTCFSPTNFHHHNTTDNVLLAFLDKLACISETVLGVGSPRQRPWQPRSLLESSLAFSKAALETLTYLQNCSSSIIGTYQL